MVCSSVVTASRVPIIDLFAPLSHKQAIGPGGNTDSSSLAPTWVPRHSRRRLDAYRIRAAYGLNIARYMARTELELVDGQVIPSSVEDRREYGDAALLVDRVVAGVLGDTFEIVVDGADADLPDEPELPDEPTDPGADGSDVAKRVFDIRTRLWTATVESILTEWEQAWTDQPALLERQDWLRTWADDELLPAKIVEGEADICGMADGVYTILWSPSKRRPIVNVYDPGMYFPVITEQTREYPDKVHLAWEFEVDDADGNCRKFVRRITFELAPILGAFDDQGLLQVSNGMMVPAVQGDRLATNKDVADGHAQPGQIVREYPWNVDDDGKIVPSAVTCYLTDATWKLEDLGPRKADNFDLSNAVIAASEDGRPALRLDLLHDFLPVIHIPNTPASKEHFGQSVLDLVMQILDDIQIGDTDIFNASALAAGPAVALAASKTAETLRVAPGAVFNLGENGKMDVLDLSKGLAELAKIQDGRLDRLSVNGRVPNEVLGRTQGSGDLAGIAILLRFGPFIQLVGKLRMTREPKYRLLLKFAQRLAMLGGVLAPGPVPATHLAFGSFLPSDRAQLVEQITKLIVAKAISTQTAVQLLVAGGFAVDDARGEVQRIHAENTEAAKHLADATGSEELAADWLGVELPASGTNPPGKPGPPPAPSPVAPPVPVLPPTPPAP